MEATKNRDDVGLFPIYFKLYGEQAAQVSSSVYRAKPDLFGYVTSRGLLPERASYNEVEEILDAAMDVLNDKYIFTGKISEPAKAISVSKKSLDSKSVKLRDANSMSCLYSMRVVGVRTTITPRNITPALNLRGMATNVLTIAKIWSACGKSAESKQSAIGQR